MNKPALIIVTGRPASGKTTLAHTLSLEMKYPLLSRDELKEGYINTVGVPHHQLDDTVARHIYSAFFEVVELLLDKNISVIIEAAFQHSLWEQRLLMLSDKASIKVIICRAPLEMTRQRFERRLSTDPGREKFHGDDTLNTSGQLSQLFTDAYEAIHIDAPTLEVDTSEDYQPDIKGIIGFLLRKGG